MILVVVVVLLVVLVGVLVVALVVVLVLVLVVLVLVLVAFSIGGGGGFDGGVDGGSGGGGSFGGSIGGSIGGGGIGVEGIGIGGGGGGFGDGGGGGVGSGVGGGGGHFGKDKAIPKKYKKQLCLFWFVHYVILGRDVNKVIEDDLLDLVEDLKKFNNYLWRYNSYKLTVKYLLTKLSPKTIILYGFPWAFMPFFPTKSRSRITRMRFLIQGSLGGCLQRATRELRRVVHPWILSTEHELGMTSFITLDLINTIADPIVKLIKKELAGATSIRRAFRQGQPNVEALHNQPIVIDLGAASGGVAGGVVDVGGSHADASRDDEHLDAQEKIRVQGQTG
ncbi:hypothetical protein P3S67_001490 [Capsicum chacoense]